MKAIEKRLEERMDMMIQSVRREAEINREADKEALKKLEVASEKRFESVNEFRAALTDQTSTFMPRSEVESRISASSEKLNELADRMNRNDGKGSGLKDGWGYIVGGLGLIAAVVMALRH